MSSEKSDDEEPDIKLSSKHTRTLASIFEKPTRSDVTWSSVMALLKKLGAVVDEKRAGSRVAFFLKGRVFVLHKPHPDPTLSKGALEALRSHLKGCDIHP